MKGIAEILANIGPDPREREDRTGMYRLYDNLVGIDDGVDTPGERLGAGINSLATGLWDDPVGMVGGMGKAIDADLRNLMFEGGARERPQDVLGYAAAPMAPGAARALKYNPNRTHIFAGPNAKTADKALMARAEDMLAKGASRDDVWRETGWFRGNDGKMRFEIDDSGAGLKRGTIDETALKRRQTLDKSLNHDDLFAAYPDAADTRLLPGYGADANTHGWFTDADNTISINRTGPAWRDKDAFMDTVLHEGQHGVQGREGFAVGGNPSQFYPEAQIQRAQELDGLQDKLIGKSWRETDPERKARIRSIADRAGERKDAVRQKGNEWRFDQYRRQAGEVEARNVEARRNLTPEQRRDTPPWATQDVPDADQLVQFDSNYGMSASQPTPAQEVADMLATGRAGDVTDEIMALIDPQEMHRLYESGATGMPMPMDQASRMARAREMGFDDGYFKGAGGDYGQFKAGSDGSMGAGVYVTPYAEVASKYADGSVYPLAVRGDISDLGARGMAYPMAGADDARRLGASGSSRDWDVNIFDPANIRSQFARFDPRLKHLANLSAGIGGVAMLTPEEEAAEIRAYLEGIQ